MVATKTAKRPSARERLLAASDELFYRDGVHSTGIEAVIEKAGVAKGSLYYIFGGKDELVAAYLRGRHEAWRQRVEAAQAGADDPDEKILAVFDAIADYVSLPEFRGCPFDNAAAEAPAGECQKQANKDYRDWLRQYFFELAAATGVADLPSAGRRAPRPVQRRTGHREHGRAREHRRDHRQTHREADPGGRESLELGLIRVSRGRRLPGSSEGVLLQVGLNSFIESRFWTGGDSG